MVRSNWPTRLITTIMVWTVVVPVMAVPAMAWQEPPAPDEIAQPPETPSDDATASDAPVTALTVLQSSLKNVPELETVEIMGAEPDPEDGTKLNLVGVLATEDQRAQVEQQALTALENAKQLNVLDTNYTSCSAESMRVRSEVGAMAWPWAVEDLISAKITAAPETGLRVSSYDGVTGHIRLVGTVSSGQERRSVVESVSSLERVREVDDSGVVVAELVGVGFNPAFYYDRAIAALGRGTPTELLQSTDEMLRRGINEPAVWYLRAAAHLWLAEWAAARGDVLMTGGDPIRYRVLERFQGPLRWKLEEFVAAGNEIAIVPIPEPPPAPPNP